MTRPDPDGPGGDNRRRHASTSRRRGWLWAAAAVAVASLAVGIVDVALTGAPRSDASGISSTSNTSSTSSVTNAAAARPSPSAPYATATMHRASAKEPRTAAALGLTAGALPLPGKQKAQIAAWKSGRGGTALAAVSAQLGSVTQSGAVGKYVEMKAACSSLAASVRTAQAEPPIPVAAMQAMYAQALANLAKGAADCYNAISEQGQDELTLTHENSALLSASQSALNTGAKELYKATAEIAALHTP